MKNLFVFLILMFFGSFALATEWKVVAETTDCLNKAEILAKEDEEYVLLKVADKQEKLHAEKGTVYKTDAMNSTIFSSGKYIFTYPSIVESNSPKLVVKGDANSRCQMKLR